MHHHESALCIMHNFLRTSWECILYTTVYRIKFQTSWHWFHKHINQIYAHPHGFFWYCRNHFIGMKIPIELFLIWSCQITYEAFNKNLFVKLVKLRWIINFVWLSCLIHSVVCRKLFYESQTRVLPSNLTEQNALIN